MKKKILILTLLILAFISISGAYASDVNDTLTDSDDSATIDAVQIDEITASDASQSIGQSESEILSADDGTYSDLSAEIGEGGDKSLTKSYYRYEGGSTIEIKNSGIINGNGAVIDMAGSNIRAFSITASGVTINNLTIKNANFNGNGGAIHWNGVYGNISHCTFINNTAHNAGGAVYWYGENGTVSNSIFINNTASNGGAIYWNKIGGNISYCVFLNNSAINDGGAIYGNRHILANYCWFGNNATNYNDPLPIAQACYCDTRLFLDATANPSRIYIPNTSDIIFRLYLYTSEVSEFDNTPFKSLDLTITATNGNVSKNIAKLGESIRFTPTENGTATVTAKIENVAQTGEIYVGKGDFDLLQDLVNNESLSLINLERNYTYNKFDAMTEGILINRPITINGNGYTIDAKGKTNIFVVNADNVVIENITFLNGNGSAGGAIGGWAHNCNVSGCSFENNTANEGGAISWWGNGVHVSNCLFVNNSAIENGGAISWIGSSCITNCLFVNNSAEDGGAYYDYNGDSSSCFNNNILINNRKTEIGFAGYYNGDFNSNWFGHTAENYGTRPAFDNVNVTVWLFLNATANPDSISIFNTSDITFKLYLYNSTSGNITEHDNAPFQNLKLTITAKNGNAGKKIAKLGESIRFTPTKKGTATVTATVGNTSQTVEITVVKGDFDLLWDLMDNETLSVINLECNYTYNEFDSMTDGVRITRPITIDGNGHTIDAKGKTTVFSVVASGVTIKNLTIKNANHNDDGGAICWGGKDGSVSNCTFINNTANGDGGAIYWIGEGGSVSNCTFINNTAREDGGAIEWDEKNGSVSNCIFINNTANGNGGAVEWDQKYGNISYCVFLNNSADNEGDAIYGFSTITAYYCWFGNNATNYDENLPIANSASCDTRLFLNATANPDSIPVSGTSEVIFKLYLYNNSEVSEFDNSPFKYITLKLTADNGDVVGIAKLDEPVTYTATSIGTGDITASIENVKYAIETTNLGFDPDLSVNPQETDYSSSPIIALNYNSSATGTVNITLKGKNGNNYTFTDLALNATVMLPQAINADEYDVNVTYSGDNVFLNSTANATLTVNKVNSTLTVNNMTFDYDDEGSCEVSYAGATGVEAKVIGHDKAVVNVTGNIITVSNLDAGNYTLTVTTIADANHNNVTKTANIAVNKVDSALTVSDVALDYGTSTKLAVTTECATGITAKINDKEAVVENNTIAIPVLDAGTYTLTVTTITDANHNPVTKTATITVNKLKTQLTAKAVTATYNADKKLVITLKDADGKALSGAKITVKLKGTKTYTTDKNGQVKISTKALVPKKYTAKITFNGNKNYAKSTKDVKVTVKKAKAKIYAKKKTYRANKKTKKFKIKLKDKNGKAIKKAKVRLIVKKTSKSKSKKSEKKYKKNIKKTNKKGKITFKIKRNKKGKYKATVKFYGNKYYKKASKKVKIKLK